MVLTDFNLFLTALRKAGHTVETKAFFDTLKVKPSDVSAVRERAASKRINLRYFDDGAVGAHEFIVCASCARV